LHLWLDRLNLKRDYSKDLTFIPGMSYNYWFSCDFEIKNLNQNNIGLFGEINILSIGGK
jgi:hypothetical protein